MSERRVQFAPSFVATTAILILFLYLNDSASSLYISAHENTNHSVGGRPAAAFIANNNNNNQNLQPLNNKKKDERESTTTTSLHAMSAWSCHGKNQRDLVNCLMQAGIVKQESVRDALSHVDRKHYAPASDTPYMDAPQPIGMGQTISAPHMHAHVLEEMYPYLKNSKDQQLSILDVGSGSGYLTAALARWVAPLKPGSQSSFLDNNKIGKVYGIEVYDHLLDFARENIERSDKDLLDNGTLSLQKADGWKGLPEASPFDAIHVGAAASDFPKPLLEQLKVGGVLIIPVGPQDGAQSLSLVERIGDGVTENDYRIKELLGVRYVPLVHQM